MKPKKRSIKAQTIDTSQANLVIVESPAKAKTIKKYLGNGFEVVASMGHIVDLPRKGIAIDIENNFLPTYEVSPEKRAVVSALKHAVKSVKQVRLATDEDREGEAIARHICRTLGLDEKKTPRIVFHEITKDAIQKAIQHPRALDRDLVDAQQARRVLDRLVGFELSPVLRKKVKPSLSAGRVQSVAVRLLVEREREIIAFAPDRFFKVTGTFEAKNGAFTAGLEKPLREKGAVEDFLKHCTSASFTVNDVQKKPGTRNPSAPFTTSTLQQEASRKLGFSVSRTMQLAQRLYEAGLITYMRTDSVSLSKQAIASATGVIQKEFGDKYVQVRQFATKSKGAQEAHEAIRPTDMKTKQAGADDSQKKLYRLIRQRTIASQMASATIEKTEIGISISGDKRLFVATGEVIVFDGFLAVYPSSATADDVAVLPAVTVGEVLAMQQVEAQESLTKGPARFSEAGLVKKLEELGIGRPSTYAPTIATIQDRGYVENRDSQGDPQTLEKAVLKKGSIKRSSAIKYVSAFKNKLVPTAIGMVVTDFLVENFPDVLNYQFTATVEQQFDTIAEGALPWQTMIKNFYTPFHKTIEAVTDHAERASGERVLGNDPKTGKVVKVRIGRYGPLVQIGEQDDPDKKFASLRGGQTMETITMEEALDAFALPRHLGERNGKKVVASAGRFGPYVQRGNTFASLKHPDDPLSISYERAIEMLEEKIAKDIEKTLLTFEYRGEPGVVMKGRRGPFIKRNRKTIKLTVKPGVVPTVDEVFAILEKEVPEKKAAASKKRSSSGAKKKPTRKKAATKKKTAPKTGGAASKKK